MIKESNGYAAKARATTAPASPRSTKVQHVVTVNGRSSDHYICTQPTHIWIIFGVVTKTGVVMLQNKNLLEICWISLDMVGILGVYQ